jgi:hypothetical protein
MREDYSLAPCERASVNWAAVIAMALIAAFWTCVFWVIWWAVV